MKKSLLFAGVLFSCLYSIGQITVDITPSKDNTIFEDNVNNSDALGNLRSGAECGPTSRRALLHFDIAGNVPAGVLITNVTLELDLTSSGIGAGTDDYSLHTVTQDWGEGTSDAGAGTSGVAATASDATWNESFSGTTNWGTAGGSYIATASGTTTLTVVNGIYSWTSAGMTSDVQNWLSAPTINYGWILIGDESTPCSVRTFGSKDAGVSPVLKVKYSCAGAVTATCQDLNVYLDVLGNATINDIDLDAGSSATCPGSLNFIASQTTFDCSDIVTAPVGTMIITGVIDGPLIGGTPKAVELYVNENIADLSLYGIGSANNGGGSDGEEFTFPAVAVSAGTFIYVATEAIEFTNWFGFAPD
jgi:hypothetical protein